ncbi:MAG: flagellar FlbD family protein [Firmicutes bacterium]|nr:flagellar FlbD family protein [Bacillota bacterium]
MIKVNRLDQKEIVVNAELIETVEATPDTIITLTTGRKLLVRQGVDEVIQKVIDYRRCIAQGLTFKHPGEAPGRYGPDQRGLGDESVEDRDAGA